MFGNHSTFYEASYDSSFAAGSSGTATEKYLVYLPKDYFETDKYYPTAYLLHQFNSDHTSYMTDHVDQLLNEAIESGMIDDMIVVIPNSAESSWWKDNWEKMITDELIPMIDSTYRTIKDSRYRLTAGASMGGQGAYGVALRNPDFFSGAISFFGAFSMGGNNSPNVIANQESAEYLNYYALYFMCGNQDLYGFGVPAIELDKQLTEKGVDHYFFIENGDHNSEFYIPYFKSAFAYARDNMYKSDASVDSIVSGKTTTSSTKDGLKLIGTLNVNDKIANYLNKIPASSYTKDSNPALSIPLTMSVVQDGITVFQTVERDNMVKAAGSKEFTYDIKDSVNQDKAFDVVWSASIFDRTITLDKTTVKPATDGFVTKNGTIYFYQNGKPVSAGWHQAGQTWCYTNASGEVATGWKTVGEKRYYFDSEGKMLIGWQNIGGNWYYLSGTYSDGSMKTGWLKSGSNWYYLGTDGAMRYDWQLIGGKWYYLSNSINDGSMKIGWQKIDGKWYYLSNSIDDGS
ncbi:MAG: hypothetical protein EOM18_15525, partial [Clostridia bacterium]|nr:hypothetical protein [Clostridia bacterium]